MLGLMIKDFALLKVQLRSLVIIFAIAIFMLIAGQNTGFVVMYANIVFMMFGISTLSYDSFDNGYAFLFTLPITRKLYVKEKYVFSLSLLALGCVLSFIMLFALGSTSDFDLGFLVGYMFGGLLFLSIMLPVNIKFGPEKARIALIAIMIIIISSVYMIVDIANKLDMEKYFGELEHIGGPAILIFLGIVVMIMLFLSYKISCRVMEKKEF